MPLYIYHQSSRSFDVSGAGDTVIAYIASGVANGRSLFNATEIANDAAGNFSWKVWDHGCK